MSNTFKYAVPTILFTLLVYNAAIHTYLPFKESAYTTLSWTFNISFFVMVVLMLRKKDILLNTQYTLFHLGVSMFLIGVAVIDLTKSHDHNSLLLMILYISFFVAISYISWRPKQLQIFGVLAVVFLLWIVFQWSQAGYIDNRYSGYFYNTNVKGIFVASLIFFPIAAYRNAPIYLRIFYTVGIIGGLVMTYVSTARSAMLLLVVAIGAWLVLRFSNKLFFYLFHIILLCSALFVLVYHLLAMSRFATGLNEWSLEQFGKSFFSGRQHIWGESVQYALNAPILGHKVGIAPKDFMEGTHYVHTHNQYIQIFLESGIVGLGLFVLMLYGIWVVLQKNLQSSVVQWSACFFLGILVYQTVEISLFFNMKPIGLFHWFMIGLGVSGVLFHQKQSNRRIRQHYK
ncbi:O-antigen ligase family protein [Lentibacillus saliphilus]|uniref:O-antigen ligase family protein n=1 Tax=Lentibacillus saliphilus TaxID=2737028 RepID=UPI001C309AA5|nr:O-antigen ligase family protein [Lentibacillus saliphilus]